MQYRSYQAALIAVESIEFTGHPRSRFKTRSEFARKARSWSEARMRQEVQRLDRAQAMRNRYQELRQRSFSAVESRRGSTSEARFRRLIEFKDAVLPPKPKETKKEAWERWGKDHRYPEWVKSQVASINNQEGYEDDAAYGFAVMYYHYVWDLDIELVKQYLDVSDRFGDIYENLIKKYMI